MSQSKGCSQCRQDLPIEAFAADRRRKSGLQAACRKCQRRLYDTPAHKAQRARRTGRVTAPYRTREQRAAEAKQARRIAKERAQANLLLLEQERAHWAEWRRWMLEDAPMEWLRARREFSGGTWPAPYTPLWHKVATDNDKAEYLANARTAYARRYAADPKKERERSATYKHANPDRVRRWQGKRTAMAAAAADNTLSRDVVGGMFALAKTCPYCGGNLKGMRKSLDHMVPISRGGAHSAINVIICCWDCNLKKGGREFADWLDTLIEPYASRMASLYRKRFRAEPAQAPMAFTFSPAP